MRWGAHTGCCCLWQDIITHLIALARAEDKGVRLRVCQLLQSIVNNQVLLRHGEESHSASLINQALPVGVKDYA